MIKNILLLVFGSGTAQLIPILTTPILAKLYSTESFGNFAIFSTMLLIFGVFSTGKYEFAIALASSRKNAEFVYSLSIILAITSFFVLLLIVPVIQFCLAKIYVHTQLSWVWYLPFSVLSLSIINASSFMLNRINDFKTIAKMRVLQALFIATLGIGLAKVSDDGLIISSFFSSTIVAILFLFYVKKRLVFNFKKFKYFAIKYKSFPQFFILGSAFNALSSQLPILLFANLYGASTVGTLFLAQRLIALPSALISRAVGEAMRQKLSQKIINGNHSSAFFIKSTRNLFLLGFIPFLFAFYVLPKMTVFFLGDEWKDVGTIIKVLIPMYYIQFSVSSLSSVAIQLTEKLKIDLLWQISLFFCTLIAMIFTDKLFGKINITLFAFSLVYIIHYLFSYLLAYRFLNNVDKNSTFHSR